MANVAHIVERNVDWSKLKKQLDHVTCIRPEHPRCEYHYTEAQAFASLSRQIRETKELIQELTTLKSKAPDNKGQCEKHWLRDCFECSLKGKLDRSTQTARKVLGKLRFRLISLPTVAEALGRTPTGASGVFDTGRVEPTAEKMSPPVERLFGRDRSGFETTRMTASDIADNIRLIEAWLRDRAQAA